MKKTRRNDLQAYIIQQATIKQMLNSVRKVEFIDHRIFMSVQLSFGADENGHGNVTRARYAHLAACR